MESSHFRSRSRTASGERRAEVLGEQIIADWKRQLYFVVIDYRLQKETGTGKGATEYFP